jgi:hypothetical protein
MHLYAVYLGGDMGNGRMGEDHEVVFVVGGADLKKVRDAARKKWGGTGRAHIDAVQRLDRVDGHRIEIAAADDDGDDVALDNTYHR